MKYNKLWRVAIIILLMFLLSLSIYVIVYVLSNNISNKDNTIINTAITNEVIENIDTWMQKVLLTWPFHNNSESMGINQYPAIKINKKIDSWKISFNISVSDSMKKSWYLKSDNYCFSFRFFIWDFGNWWYYNVFRNSNNGVANDQSIWLNWCIPWVVLANSNTRTIPLSDSIIVANDKDSYWYHTINTLSFINDNAGKTVNLWGYLSSVKEVPNGWMFTVINSITIEYDGDKDSIEIVK